MLLVIFLTVNNVFWLQRHLLTIPPPWDQAGYLYMSLRYLHALSDGGLLAMVNEFIYRSLHLTHTAPLFPLTTVPLYLLFGESRLVAHLIQSFYLLLLLSGVYLLGKAIYGPRAGMVAMYLISTFTGIVHYSRDYLLDFPAAAVVTVGIYAMIQSEEFRHRGWSLLFGGLVGLALLTKSMAGVFFVGPVIYTFGCLIRPRQLTLARLTNLLVSVSTAVLAIAVWWGPNFQMALEWLTYYGFGEGSATSPRPLEGEFLVLRTLLLYPLFIVNEGMSFLYAILFSGLVLARAVKTIGRWKRTGLKGTTVRSKEGYLWMWLLIGYAVLTAVPLKNGRQTLALLPPLALLLAGCIDSLDTRWLRRSVLVIAMMVGTVNYVGTTYETPLIPKEVSILPPFFFIKHQYSHYSWIRSYLHPSADTQWPIEDILFILARRAAGIEERNIESGRIQFPNRAQSLSSEAYVWLVYYQLLKREPDEKESRGYVEALREGTLTREGIFDAIIASSEYRERPSRILVVPLHPVFNAGTLQYYAELRRYPLSFFDYPLSFFDIQFDIHNNSLTRDQLQTYDFVLWKNGGYQRPTLTPYYGLTTRYNMRFYAELLKPDSGFVPLSQTFAFPDASHIVIFAATYTLN
ncbi:MAG: glycosyltransferase family 39 protein [Candidatus Entotheonellia bacterium]